MLPNPQTKKSGEAKSALPTYMIQDGAEARYQRTTCSIRSISLNPKKHRP